MTAIGQKLPCDRRIVHPPVVPGDRIRSLDPRRLTTPEALSRSILGLTQKKQRGLPLGGSQSLSGGDCLRLSRRFLAWLVGSPRRYPTKWPTCADDCDAERQA